LRSVFLEGAASASANGNGTNGARKAPTRRKTAAVARREAATAKPAILEVQGLTKRFGGITAVYDVSFVLPEDQILGLIGPNGAGKTTIFDLLSGLLPMDAGRMILKGVDVTRWGADRRAAIGLGRSFQDA